MKLHHSIRHTIKHHSVIHPRLKRRLVVFPFISLVMFIVVGVDAITGGITPFWILTGATVGMLVGFGASLIYKIQWREDQHKVASGIDRMTVILILAYIVFRIASEHLVTQFVHGQELFILTFSFLGGLLIGRMAGVFYKVSQVMQSKPVLAHIKKLPYKNRTKASIKHR